MSQNASWLFVPCVKEWCSAATVWLETAEYNVQGTDKATRGHLLLSGGMVHSGTVCIVIVCQ